MRDDRVDAGLNGTLDTGSAFELTCKVREKGLRREESAGVRHFVFPRINPFWLVMLFVSW